MRNGLYRRLAATNLKKNRRIYLPYLFACIATVMMFCILLTLQRDKALLTMSGGSSVAITLNFGCVIIAIFSAVILFYTNSVMIKQRKKEFGLYNILGMEKRHVGRVLLWETVYTALIAFIVGVLTSILFSKLMQLLLVRLLGGDVKFGMNIDPTAIVSTLVLYAIIFFLIYLNTLRIIHLSNPIELLRGASEGEKEPRSNWILALLGIICLACGYAMAIMAKTAISAMLLFFVAVLLVIAGTYLTFIAFSIVYLKSLRRNKKYYYKTRHFATVSGMLYRMKRNAAGLASVCILSTMVLVTVSTTVCLYLGSSDILDTMYPYDISIEYMPDGSSQEDLQQSAQEIKQVVSDSGLGIEKFAAYQYLQFSAFRDGDSFILDQELIANSSDSPSATVIWLTTAEAYGSLTGQNVTLSDGEALCFTDGQAPGGTIDIMGYTLNLKPISSFPLDSGYAKLGIKTLYLVVKDSQPLYELEQIQKAAYADTSSSVHASIGMDLIGSDEAKADLGRSIINIRDSKDGRISFYGNVECRQAVQQEDFISFYGAFFFLGIFLGTLFILATVLIIYYKQVSEGYDDRSRFDIMQKVGMTKAEVRSTIRTQVLIVFFLPLAAAAVHICVAFPMMTRILGAFGMINLRLFIGCTAATFVIFAVIYLLVYISTARTYYGIVNSAPES